MEGTYPERDARARAAVAGVGWAYFAAMSRGDWVRASQLLSLFQQLYRSERVAVLAGFEANVGAVGSGVIAYARALQPTVSGRLDASTVDALKIAMTAHLGGVDAVTIPLDSMPGEAAAVGSWFQTQFRQLQPNGTGLWRFDTWSVSAASADVASAVGGQVYGFIEGIDDPATTAAANTSALMQASLWALLASKGSAAPVSSPPPGNAGGDVIAIDDAQLVTATKPTARFPEIALWVLGIGLVAVAGGIFLYPAYKKARRLRAH